MTKKQQSKKRNPMAKIMRQTLYARGVKSANKKWLESRAKKEGHFSVGIVLNKIIDGLRRDSHAK